MNLTEELHLSLKHISMKTLRHIFALSILFLPALLFGQVGTPDDSFGMNGVVTTGTVNVTDQAKAVAIQSDGKIVTAGFTGVMSSANFDVHRFNGNGTLDNSFDGDGRVSTDFNGGLDASWGIAVQPDGKILAVGLVDQFTQRFGLVRYNSDGSLDNSFATGGISTVNFAGQSDKAWDVKLQDDGKIVAVGSSLQGGFDTDFCAARWKTNGQLDSTFGGQGTVLIDVGPGAGSANAVLIQPDGKIVLGGHSQAGSLYGFQFARLNSNGTLDNTFNGTGLARIEVNGIDDAASEIALQPNGKIVAFGYTSVASQYDVAIVRLNSNGSLDNSFSGDGKVSIDLGFGSDYLNGGYVRGDGKLVAIGSSTNSNADLDPLVMQFNTNGSLDNTFGVNGSSILNMDVENDGFVDCASDGNGNIVAAGFSTMPVTLNADVLVVRYLNDMDIGILEHDGLDLNSMVYPNPLGDVVTLQFELLKSANVSIELLDLQGRMLHVFQSNVNTISGEQRVELVFPTPLARGAYFIRVATEQGSTSVRVLK